MTATLLGMAAVAVAAAALGLATGWWQVLPVLSPSMRPAFDAGAAVLAVRVPAGSVRAGDVIVYRAPIQDRRLVAHRVVRIVRAGERPVVQTGGDANDASDPWLARLPDGTVWKVRAQVPHLGHALLLLRRPPVRAAMLLAGVGVALAWALRAVWSAPAYPVGWGGGLLAVLLVLAAVGAAAPPVSASFTSEATQQQAISSATLQPPTGTTATRGACTPLLAAEVDLSWTATTSTFADGYEIFRSETSGGPYGSLGTVSGAAATAFTDDTVEFATTYHYVVQATRNLWRSVDSVQASVTTPSVLCVV